MGINSFFVLGIIPVIRFENSFEDYFPLFVLKIHLGINSGPDNIQYLGFN